MTDKVRAKNKLYSEALLTTLASNIKRLRTARGWSQETLAERADMHRTFISLVERKGRNVTLGVVEALAKTLEVDVPTLLSPHEERE